MQRGRPKKIIYKISRKMARSLGYDLIPLPKEDMGIDPYLDMKKFVDSREPVLFDVGANFGQTIDNFKEVFENGIIHAFEPDPFVFQSLARKAGNLEGVQVWNFGLGSSPGSLTLNKNSHSTMSSFLEIGNKGWGYVDTRISVPVTSLDNFCAEQKIKKIDVLKIDTQGFELEVLKGSANYLNENRIGLIYLEVTFIEMYKELPKFGELFDFVVSRGFELVSIYPLTYRQKMAGWTDILFKNPRYVPQ